MLVYGDTNSTLAGALAAADRDTPVVHVEAGMRSFDRTMPEERNRVLTDQLSRLLLCASPAAVEHLRAEVRKCILLCSNCHAEVESGVSSIPR